MDRPFKITEGKGFQLTFPNRVTVSVQFGTNNDCDNRELYPKDGLVKLDDGFEIRKSNLEAGHNGCMNADVAVWYQPDTVIPDQIPIEVLDDRGRTRGFAPTCLCSRVWGLS